MKRVLILIPEASRYDSLQYFSFCLARAFESNGIQVEMLDLRKWDIGEIFSVTRKNPIDLTVAFNGVLPDSKGNFLSEYLGIPHLAILVDPPYTFLPLAKDPMQIIACVDEDYCDLFRLRGAKNVLFFPHAGEEVSLEPAVHREIPILMMGTCIDPEAILSHSQRLFGSFIIPKFDQGMELVFETSMGTLDALCQSFSVDTLALERGIDGNVSPLQLWPWFDLYIRGTARKLALEALEGFPVHLYGDTFQLDHSRSWRELLGDLKGMSIHESVTYDTSLQLIQKAQVVLNLVPVFQRGSHERIFSSLARGSSVITHRCPYSETKIPERHGVQLYDLKDPKSIVESVSFALQGGEKVREFVERGRNWVSVQHTWNERIRQVLPTLESKLLDLLTG